MRVATSEGDTSSWQPLPPTYADNFEMRRFWEAPTRKCISRTKRPTFSTFFYEEGQNTLISWDSAEGSEFPAVCATWHMRWAFFNTRNCSQDTFCTYIYVIYNIFTVRHYSGKLQITSSLCLFHHQFSSEIAPIMVFNVSFLKISDQKMKISFLHRRIVKKRTESGLSWEHSHIFNAVREKWLRNPFFSFWINKIWTIAGRHFEGLWKRQASHHICSRILN